MKPSDLKTVLAACIRNRKPVLIKGAPGVGKTDLVGQAANEEEADLLTVYCSCSDPTDPKGIGATWKDEHGNQVADFVPFGFLKQLIHATKPLVCFLDDVGGAVPSVQLAYMNLVHARKTGDGTPISDFVTFIAATNRREDRAGVQGMLEPFKSRFFTIIHLEPDLDDWCKWALGHNLPIELISFIRFRPGLLFDFKASSDLVNSPNPRTVANVGELMKIKLPSRLEFETYTGTVGEGFASELIGFLEIFHNLPNPDHILMDPDKADVPTDPATLYALCGALSRKASDSTMDRLCRYFQRLPAEFNVLAMRDCVQMDKAVCNTSAFVEWATKNKDVLI